jgi:twinkle protein
MTLTRIKSKLVRSDLPCPCGKSDRSYSLYDDGHGYCFRGDCEQPLHNNNQGETLTEATITDENVSYQYVEGRGISVATREKLGIVTKVSSEGQPLSDCVTFPNGTQQIRSLVIPKDQKGSFKTVGEHASEATLMFMDKFPAGSAKTVTITEGAYDAASLHQVLGNNFPCVSVRSSSTARKDCATQAKYLNSFDRIYLALDADEPGNKAAKEIAQLFDFNKVFHVDLSAHKDANGYLQAGLVDQLRQVWHNSKKYLPEGIVSSHDEFRKILEEHSQRPSISYPFARLQEVTKGIRDGEVVLVTAQEGVGKTEFIRAIEYHILTTTDAAVGTIHLEEDKARQLQGLAGYDLKVPAHFEGVTSNEEIAAALKRITKGSDDRLHIYKHFGSDDPNDLLNIVRFMVTSCGCKYIFFDHITMIVTGREDEDERRLLDYLSTRLATMAHDLGFTLFLVSHVNDNGQTRGSRNIGKVANTRIDLSRNTLEEMDNERNKMYLSVPKNRFGAKTGPGGVLWFDDESFTLGEYKEPIIKVPAA